MTEQNARQRGIVLHNGVMHGFVVLNEMIPTVFIAKIAERLIFADGFTVTREIHAENQKTVFGKIRRKIMIAFDVFCHAMDDLNTCARLIGSPDPITHITNPR